jgi:hypothetical protein
VGEDLNRGRVYLPQDELRQFGLTEEDLYSRQVTEKYKDFLKFQIARARDYYKEAERGIPMLAPDARFAVRASLDLYGKILEKLEANNYDNLNMRAYTSAFEKLSILPGSWMEATFKGNKLAPPALSLATYARNDDVGSQGLFGVAVMGAAVGAVVVSAVALRRRKPRGPELYLAEGNSSKAALIQ